MSSGYFEPDRRGGLQDAILTAADERRALIAACGEATRRSADALIALQEPEGYWVGDLLADTTLESDYVLLQLWLHPPRDGEWRPPVWDRIQKACRSILARQLPDGGFNIFPGGPADINASIKAYTALKLAGFDAGADFMSRLRDRMLALGGLQAANSYTKINLSLFGLYPRALCADGSAGTRAVARPHPLRNVLLDPRHRGAAVDRAGDRGTRPVPRGFHLDELAAPGKSFHCRAATRFRFCSTRSIARSSSGSGAGREKCSARPFATPKNGCSTTPATATASAPSIRP